MRGSRRDPRTRRRIRITVAAHVAAAVLIYIGFLVGQL